MWRKMLNFLAGWRRSIRVRLTIASLVLVMVPVTIISAIFYFQARDSLRQQVGAGVQSLAEAVGRDVERFLNERRGNIAILAHSSVFTSSVASAQEKTTLLLNFQTAYQGYASLYVTDAVGNIISATDRTVGNQSGRDWFKNAVSSKGIVVSDMFFLTSAQRIVVTISSPVYSADGQLLGVVAANIDGQNFSDIAAATHVGSTGKVFFVNRESRVVVDPDIAAVFTDVSNSAAVQSVLRGERGSLVSSNDQGVATFESYVPLNGAENWSAIGELPLSELDAPVLDLGTRMATITLVEIPIIILIVVLVSNSLIRPVSQLTGTTQRLQEDLSVRSEIRREDEIGLLAKSFNEMADAIQKREADLREQTIRREHLIKDLQAATRLAEENSRLKSEFLSTMSHELRTPMNAIEGFTSIMLSHMGGVEFNEKTERYITRVNVNSKRLLQLINDFLDLSRVESGRLELAHQPFSPGDLAMRWQTEIGILAEKKNIGFELTLDPHLPEKVYGDEEAISKIAINLLGNAIKFTEQGKVSLALANGGENWRISVTDTGIGIPPHAREYVFEEFRQVDQTSKRKYGGTGLGLAIVQKYARTMGGTVTLQSEVGVGSTFTVVLPIQTKLEPSESKE